MRDVIITLLLFFLSFSSCEIINPDEKIPAYIHIDSIMMEDYSSNIHDAWVNLDGNFIGVYELPCTFPVIVDSIHTLTIRGGIRNNGMSADRLIYPFYTKYEMEQIFTPGETYEISPVVEMKPSLKVVWEETFEMASHSFEKYENSDTTIVITDEDFFDGLHSGLMALDQGQEQVMVLTIDDLALPTDGSTPVYLEFDYKNNEIFYVGFYPLSGFYDDIIPFIYGYKKDNW